MSMLQEMPMSGLDPSEGAISVRYTNQMKGSVANHNAK